MYVWENKDARYRYDYGQIANDLNDAIDRNDAKSVKTIMRTFAPKDLFFLMYFICNRVDVNEPWLVDRCNEVQNKHEGTLDIWARYHYKSSFVTFGQTLQDMINYPEESNVIFSHTRAIAKSFLREIKIELQKNPRFHFCWPEIFYEIPEKEAPKWSEDVGLLNKRKTNRKELTLEAWGLVDGMPTSKHYNRRIYDDLVTEKSVNTPDQLDKLKDAWEKSLSLTDRHGLERMCGTYYHYNDLYHHIKELGVYDVREYPATINSEVGGDPVFLTKEELDKKLKEQGPFNFACQMLLNPVASDKRIFELRWLRHYTVLPVALNKYLIVDPAGERKAGSDYTVMLVVGLDQNKNYYIVDMIRDKLNLSEKWTKLRDLVEKHPGLIMVYYEKYGKDSEVAHIKECMKREGFYFRMEEMSGKEAKLDRIRALQAPFNNGEIYLPLAYSYKDSSGKVRDLVQDFIQDEYSTMPFSKHDDMLDCLARIKDPKFKGRFPSGTIKEAEKLRPKWNPLEPNIIVSDWMAYDG
jgi:predicted phage terminase large subunit-like protein